MKPIAQLMVAAGLLACASCVSYETVSEVKPPSRYAYLTGAECVLTSDCRLWLMPENKNLHTIRRTRLLGAGSSLGGTLLAELPVGTVIHIERAMYHTVHSTLTTSLFVVLGKVQVDDGTAYSFEFVPWDRTEENTWWFPWEVKGR